MIASKVVEVKLVEYTYTLDGSIAMVKTTTTTTEEKE